MFTHRNIVPRIFHATELSLRVAYSDALAVVWGAWHFFRGLRRCVAFERQAEADPVHLHAIVSGYKFLFR